MIVKNKKLLISICICILLIVLLYLLFSLFYKRRTHVITEKFQYKLCILAIFKNETMVLKTWLEHYLHQGVDHFYLIDNGSDDNPLEILQPYIDRGQVSYMFSPEKHNQAGHYNKMYMQENIKNNAEWLIVCDLDEFYYGVPDKLNKTLDDFSEHDIIYSNWRMFGSDGHKTQPANILKSIVMCEKDLHVMQKYIFQPSKVDHELNIHSISNDEKFKIIYENDKIRLNHYPIQSEEYFRKVKMTRGAADHEQYENIRDMSYFERYDQNKTEKDETLAKITAEYDP